MNVVFVHVLYECMCMLDLMLTLSYFMNLISNIVLLKLQNVHCLHNMRCLYNKEFEFEFNEY